MPVTGEVLLFSYGTLRLAEVQRAQFGRELIGWDDALPGYTARMVTISDPAVVVLSGAAEHPMVVPSGNPADVVAGVVFAVTPAELLAADAYEVDEYHRVEVTLTSGRRAWVYVDRAVAVGAWGSRQCEQPVPVSSSAEHPTAEGDELLPLLGREVPGHPKVNT